MLHSKSTNIGKSVIYENDYFTSINKTNCLASLPHDLNIYYILNF